MKKGMLCIALLSAQSMMLAMNNLSLRKSLVSEMPGDSTAKIGSPATYSEMNSCGSGSLMYSSIPSPIVGKNMIRSSIEYRALAQTKVWEAEGLYSSADMNDNKKAFNLLQEVDTLEKYHFTAAAWAKLKMGEMCYEGRGAEKNALLAYYHWARILGSQQQCEEKKSLMVFAMAQVAMCRLLFYGGAKVGKDHKRALELCADIIKHRYDAESVAKAYYWSGMIQYVENQELQDFNKALHAFEMAYTQNDSQEVKVLASLRLCDMHVLAQGVQKNYAAAVKYAQYAYSQYEQFPFDAASATVRLADLYIKGGPELRKDARLGSFYLAKAKAQTYDPLVVDDARILEKELIKKND